MALLPHLCVGDAKKAIEFYKAAFDAVEVRRMDAPDGKRLMHAEMTIGDATLMMHDDFPEYHDGKSNDPLNVGGTSVTLHQVVPDTDAAIAKAAAAGAKITMPAADMFWGDRYGRIVDPFGHEWSFGTPLAK